MENIMHDIPAVIETARLKLMLLKPEHVRAFADSRQALSQLLNAEVPTDWPVFPESMGCHQENPGRVRGTGTWISYLFIHRQDKRLIGDGGFKNQPDAEGSVETGYAVIPEYRGQGLATEAVQALLTQAFSWSEISSVCAETLPDGYASMRVVHKLGMTFNGVRHDDIDGDLYRWRVSRAEYQAFNSPLRDLDMD